MITTASGGTLTLYATGKYEYTLGGETVSAITLERIRYGARLQRASGLPVLRNVARVRRTPYQSGLAVRERRRNLSGAFAARGAIRARHVLLIDDVITSGETCARLAQVLLANKVAKVSVLALARA